MAAGGKSTDEHKADVETRVWPALQGVTVPTPTIHATELLGKDVNASIPPQDVQTDWSGRAEVDAAFTSGDIKTDIVLEYPDAGVSATVTQEWNQDGAPWEYDEYFDYDVAAPITFKPRLMTGGPAPIRTHQIAHFLVDATVLHLTDPETWEYAEETLYPDPTTGKIQVEDPVTHEITVLAEFAAVPVGDQGDGRYTCDLTVYYNFIYEVEYVRFNARDTQVWKELQQP